MLSGLTSYVPEASLTVYDNLEFLIRLLLSAALGALVGLERSKRRKEAGIRTHCIIACTSALFMIVSKYAFLDCVTIDGLYWLGLFEAAVLVAIQIILHRFPVGADALTTQEILVEMEDTDDLRGRFDDLLKSHRGQVTDSSLTREEGYLRMEITARLEPPITHDEALAFMKENPGVRRMSV